MPDLPRTKRSLLFALCSLCDRRLSYSLLRIDRTVHLGRHARDLGMRWLWQFYCVGGRGRQLARPIEAEWASLLRACAVVGQQLEQRETTQFSRSETRGPHPGSSGPLTTAFSSRGAVEDASHRNIECLNKQRSRARPDGDYSYLIAEERPARTLEPVSTRLAARRGTLCKKRSR